MTAVEIVEVAPRDGLQNESVVVATATKLELIGKAVEAGITRIESVSFVHPGRVPQMADAEAVMSEVPRDGDTRFIGLVLNERGLERALDAAVDEINMVVVTTDTFSRRNQGMSTRDAIAQWGRMSTTARSAGVATSVTVAAAFGCPFEGEVPGGRVEDVVREVAQHQPDEIALADTIGVGVPTQVTDLLDRARGVAPGATLRCHFHNTRNTGYANAVAAVAAGVGALDASLGGVGGCPFAPSATGNIATEDLVYLLHRMGVETGTRLSTLASTGTWLAEQLGKQAPALLGRAGPFPVPVG